MNAVIAPTYATPSPKPRPLWWLAMRACLTNVRIMLGGSILIFIVGACLLSLYVTTNESSSMYFDAQYKLPTRAAPSLEKIELWFGSDGFGRSILARCLLGGVVSLAVGLAAATISVVLGVGVGLIAGFRGGFIDSALMRFVDVMYGLPYILLIILFRIAFEEPLARVFNSKSANLIVLFGAIGLVS